MFSASIKSGRNSGSTPDPQFNYVTMLLHGDGTNGAQNNTFLDSSSNNFTITRNGNTTQGSFSPYGSNWSYYFDGVSKITTPSSANLALGSGNWTVQFWANFTADPTDNQTAVELTSMRMIIGRKINKKVRIYLNGDQDTADSGPTLANGQWNYIVVARTGTTVNVYVNSTSVYSFTDSSNFSISTIASIGRNSDAAEPMTGYVSNVRVLKGTYDISLPTAPYTAITNTQLLTCQSNRFIDNSANNFALTITTTGAPSVQRFNPFGTSTAYSTSVIGGSAYFDGSGDYLSIASNAALLPGSGDFTFEAWVYFPDNTGDYALYCGSSGTGAMDIRRVGTTLRLGRYNTAFDNTSSTINIANTWAHLAISRSGTSLYMFCNGVSIYSGSNSINYPSGGVTIGSDNGEVFALGYISNLRFVKGTALYTSAFTPPTAPATAVSGTSVLTNFINAGIYDNAMMNDLETVGNAQISTSVVKYGTGSLAFNGTNAYLTTINKPPINLEGNFTVECWLYQAVSSTNSPLISLGADTFQSGTFILYIDTNQKLSMYVNGSVTVGTTTAAVTTWHHAAMVRSGSTITFYLNGVSQGTTTNSVVFSGLIELGRTVYAGTTGYGNGYIDDLRITKGYARYTTNFTPPTAAFPNTGPN